MCHFRTIAGSPVGCCRYFDIGIAGAKDANISLERVQWSTIDSMCNVLT